jgi:DNA-binding IclR family transcriptional regulator
VIKEAANSNVISKTLAVLKAFTDQQMEWGVNELARYLDVPVSSLHRILKILKNEGILEVSSESGKYRFGLEMVRMASVISAKIDIKNVARPCMKRLSNVLNESVYLAIYHPQHKKMSFIDSVHSSNVFQYVLEIGVLQPLYIAASGKVILAFLNSTEIEAVFQEADINEEEEKGIRKEIELIYSQGYALTSNERNIGAFGIGAPIFNASQEVMGSIISVIPLNNFNENKKDTIIRHVKEEAINISRALGYRQ